MQNLRAKYSKRLRIKALIGRVFDKAFQQYTGKQRLGVPFRGPSGRMFVVDPETHRPHPWAPEQNIPGTQVGGQQVRPSPFSAIGSGPAIPTKLPGHPTSKTSKKRVARKEAKQGYRRTPASDIDRLEIAAVDDLDVWPILADAYEEEGDDETANRIRSAHKKKQAIRSGQQIATTMPYAIDNPEDGSRYGADWLNRDFYDNFGDYHSTPPDWLVNEIAEHSGLTEEAAREGFISLRTYANVPPESDQGRRTWLVTRLAGNLVRDLESLDPESGMNDMFAPSAPLMDLRSRVYGLIGSEDVDDALRIGDAVVEYVHNTHLDAEAGAGDLPDYAEQHMQVLEQGLRTVRSEIGNK